jgi:hypothetical protein
LFRFAVNRACLDADLGFGSLGPSGFYVEVLGRDYTCFDANNYGTLVIMDPEEV